MSSQAMRQRSTAAGAGAVPSQHQHQQPPPHQTQQHRPRQSQLQQKAKGGSPGARTPLQEYLNAATMLLPNCVGVWFLLHHADAETGLPAPVPRAALYIMLATAVHMVFSVAFHVNNALQLNTGVWDQRLQLWIMPCGRRWHPTAHNSYRRLDQTFIHVSGIAYTYSFSQEPVFWALGLLWNAYAIYYIWAKDPERKDPPFVFESNFKAEGPRRRVLHIGMAAMLYLAALACEGDVWGAVRIWLALTFATAFFALQPCIGGYGHSLFHIGLVVFYKCSLDAAVVVHLHDAPLFRITA